MENLTAGKPPEDVFGHFGDGADLIVGAANGEPVTVLDALGAESGRLSGVTLHQTLALRKRRYMHGASSLRSRFQLLCVPPVWWMPTRTERIEFLSRIMVSKKGFL